MNKQTLKRWPVMILSLVAIVVVFIRCSSEDFFQGGAGGNGVPGLAQGFLVDDNGNPISGATLYFLGDGLDLTSFSELQQDGYYAVTTGDGLTCDDPIDPDTLSALDTVDAYDCSDALGGYVLTCGTGDSTRIAVVLFDDDIIGGIELVCGAAPTFTDPDGNLVGTPTPTPTPTPSP